MSTDGAHDQRLALIHDDQTLSANGRELVKQSISVMMSPENLKAIDQHVGDPHPGESMECYLDRAKAIVFDMMVKSF